MARLRSCSYCGGIHKSTEVCKLKPRARTFNKVRSEADKLRGLSIWRKTRNNIKERDNYLCQICKRNLYKTMVQYNYKDNIQVHHIVPIEEDKSIWLDDDNLITICMYHHRLAEDGVIPRKELKDIVNSIIGSTPPML